MSFRPLAGLGVIQQEQAEEGGAGEMPGFRPLAGLGVIQHGVEVGFHGHDVFPEFPSPRGAWGNSTLYQGS